MGAKPGVKKGLRSNKSIKTKSLAGFLQWIGFEAGIEVIRKITW